MTFEKRKPRLAVVSPFLDKSHGTERIVVEWIAQLADQFEIHVYSQRVEDLDASTVTWHRIPRLPGPHLVSFLWWFAANHAWRAWDRRFRGLRYDIVFSPGPNCLNADAVSIHIVFAEFLRRVRPELRFARNPLRTWPRLLHRKLYYQLAIVLEHLVYTKPRAQLILTSRRSAAELSRFYGRRDQFPVIDTGLDHKIFSPARRRALREEARRAIGLSDDIFALLLIGNDWRKKGLAALLDALVRLGDMPVWLLVVSSETAAVRQVVAHDRVRNDVVRVLPPRKDVEFYYAAADAYVGPSLEDTFALPVVEAMACGLPVIASAAAGASEIITHDVDGLILDDPRNAAGLAAMIRRLYQDKEFRNRLGERAAETTQQYTWESNGRELAAIFGGILERKSHFAAQTLAQEP
jgi:glycosyltransferase involved in cell wall biosynthesis